MPDTIHTSDHPARPENGHERTDVDFRRVLYVAVGVIVTAAAIHVGLWLLMNLYERQDQRAYGDPAAIPFAGTDRLPTPPRLEGIRPQPGAPGTGQQPATLRPSADPPKSPAPVDGYAWVDQQAGVARIPVDRAMDLLVEQEAGRARQDRQDNEAPPSDSNSGRFLKREKP